MTWECPIIQAFWEEVHSFLNIRLGLPGICAPGNSLLGLTKGILPTKFERILYRLLMFYARKSILLNWKPPKQPSVSHWITLINADLTMYKLTFASRGTPDHFNSIRDLWIISGSLKIYLGQLGDVYPLNEWRMNVVMFLFLFYKFSVVSISKHCCINLLCSISIYTLATNINRMI